MSEQFDPDMTIIERRLHGRTPGMPAPALRSRVLRAVEKKVTATKSGKDAQAHFPSYADLVAVTFLPGAAIAVALLLLLTLILPQLAMHAHFQPPGWQPLPMLAERGRAVGIEFDLAPAHAGQLAVGAPMTHSQVSPAHALRPIDLRRLLEGEL